MASAAIATALLGAPFAYSATSDGADVQRWINAHAQRSNSEELTSARSSVVGDLDGDARNDLAMLWRTGRGGVESALFRLHSNGFPRTEQSHGQRRQAHQTR